MKPSSVISLIVAVVIIVIGLVTCFVAQNMAKTNGELLFSEETEGGYVKTVDLSDSSISKIQLIVSNAEINIKGNSNHPYIEFLNFRESFYSLTTSSHALSFDEIPDIASMFKFWENGFSFKGMRFLLLNFKKENPDTKKIINIYLSDDSSVKVFDIKADSCKVNINDMSTTSDYKFNVSEADIEIKALKTSSSLLINADQDSSFAKRVALALDTVYVNTLTVNSEELILDADFFKCYSSTEINCESGNIDFDVVNSLDSTVLSLETETGNITVNGTLAEKTYIKNSDSADKTFSINAKSADINLTSSARESGNTDKGN